MAGVWRPLFPDPALSEPERPGLRPHRHRPNRLWPWLFEQHQVWVDYYGNEQEIESMSAAYAANVLAFCHLEAGRICLLALERMLERELGRRASDPELASALAAAGEPHAFLEQTPLVRALRRRLEDVPAERG